MSLASLTVDLTLGLARFESDAGKAAQIVARDFEKMSRPAAALQKSIERLAASAGKTSTELLTIRAATLGLGDATIDLIQKVGGTTAAFSGVGQRGVAAMEAVGTAAQGAASQSNALLTTLVGKMREVDAQAKALSASAIAQNRAGSLTDDGLKVKLAQIREVAAAEQQRIVKSYEADKAAKATAEAETAVLAKRIEATERLRQSVAKLNYEQEQKAKAATEAKTAALKASNDAYLASLEKTVATIGKSRSEIVAMELAQRGLTERGAPLVARLRDLDAATGQLGKKAFASRNQLLTLQYTIGDVAASAASGISPLTILLQQGGQIFDAFSGDKGGIGNVFRGLLQIFTPLRLAVGGAATAVGALAYAFVQGAKQSREFADAVVLSGNYAGVTEGQFNALAKSISASGQVNIASAREYTQALIATGEIGPAVFGKAADAAARYGEATGKNAKQVAAEFAALNQDVTAGAAKLNQSLNFLSASQLQQIRSLQDQGRATQALGIVYDELNARLTSLEPNLGTIERLLRDVGNEWRRFWDAAFDIGRTETIDDKLRNAQERIRLAENAGTERVSQTQLDPERRAQVVSGGRLDALREEERYLLRLKEKQDGAAAAVAATAALDKRAAAADEYVRGFERRAKAVSGLNRELDEAKRKFADQDARAASDKSYTPSSAATRATILAKIREDYTDKRGASEGEQVLKAQRDQALKDVDQALRQERAAYAFQTQFLNGVYQQQLISLDDFYAERQAAADADEAQQRASFAARIKILEAYKAATSDASERITAQTSINETRAAAEEAELQRQRRNIDLAVERAGATKQLTDRILEYRAQLLQLEGDEESAARVRTQLAIANAQLFATTAGGRISDEDIQRQKIALENLDRFNTLQRKTSELAAASASAEEAFTLLAVQRGASLRDAEQGIYAIRAKSLEQLKQLADAAAALAANSSAPRIIQAAADLGLQYAKALDVVAPALNRLRESVRGVADSISNDIADAINEFKGLPALIDAIGKDLLRAGTNLLITQPLKVGLEGALRQLTEGANPIGDFFKGALGIQGGAGVAAQTVAVQSSTTALIALTNAATAASVALGGQSAGATGGGLFGFFSNLFGGGSGGIAGNDIGLAFHSGGIVGIGGAPRSVSAAMFSGARRFHGGGIPGLMAGEVPAVLMGGPRGRREEVLTAGDPRHSDNGGRMGRVYVTNNFTISGPTDRRSQEQIAAAAARGMRSAAARY